MYETTKTFTHSTSTNYAHPYFLPATFILFHENGARWWDLRESMPNIWLLLGGGERPEKRGT